MISPRLRGLPAGGFCLRQQLVWLVLAVSIQSVIGPRPSAAPRNRDDLEQGRVLQTTAALRRQLLDAFVDWIQNQEASATGARPFASLARETCDGVAGRIRPSSLRDWGKPTNICGNNQCGPTEIPILEENDDWPVATGNYLGKLTPISNASSNPETSLGGNGEHFNFLEVAPPSSAAFVGLLRFTAACRTFLLEGQALCTERSDRSRQCSSHPAASNKDQNAGSSFSKCPARRAARDRFLAEVFKFHDSERTSLAALASPV